MTVHGLSGVQIRRCRLLRLFTLPSRKLLVSTGPIQLYDRASSTYTYVVVDDASKKAVIIDSVNEQVARDLEVLERLNLSLEWVVETHVHADHITGSALLCEKTGAKPAAPKYAGISSAHRQLIHGEQLRFGGQTILALHTPGHTSGCMSYLWRTHVFTGDTLLIDGCGRTDFQTGSPQVLFSSINDILFTLPGDTTVWPGHDYLGRESTCIDAEKRGNSRIAGKTLTEFVQLMNQLNLKPPSRLDECVRANLQGGTDTSIRV